MACTLRLRAPQTTHGALATLPAAGTAQAATRRASSCSAQALLHPSHQFLLSPSLPCPPPPSRVCRLLNGRGAAREGGSRGEVRLGQMEQLGRAAEEAEAAAPHRSSGGQRRARLVGSLCGCSPHDDVAPPAQQHRLALPLEQHPEFAAVGHCAAVREGPWQAVMAVWVRAWRWLASQFQLAWLGWALGQAEQPGRPSLHLSLPGAWPEPEHARPLSRAGTTNVTRTDSNVTVSHVTVPVATHPRPGH